jgi:DNA-binding NarL/FixJ family response regulator
MYKILLCDDHPLVIDGMKLLLKELDEFQVIGCVYNGKEALEYLAEHHVDILLLDINMPVLNGLETMKVIQKDFPEVKVIMLSMLDDLNVIKHLIDHGAMGYLIKNAGKDEILETIHTVAKGKKAFDTELLMEMVSLKEKRIRNQEHSLFPKLSRREKEILKLIVNEHTTAEIAEKLFISFGTVETHRRNMLNKLGLRNTAGLVRTAIEFGLIN